MFPVSRELPVEGEIIQTQLHSRTSEEYYTYSNVPWKLYMRKEVHFTDMIWFNANLIHNTTRTFDKLTNFEPLYKAIML